MKVGSLLDTAQETLKERLAEIRDLATAAHADSQLRARLVSELGAITEHIELVMENWLTLDEEAREILDLLALFEYDADAATGTFGPSDSEAVPEPFSKLLEPEQEDPLAASMRKGMAFFDLWLFSDAAQTLAQVVRMEPDNAVAKLFLAASETAQGRFEQVADMVQDLVQRAEHPTLRCAACEIAAQGYFACGRLEDAIDSLQHVVSLMPDYPDTWYNLGVCYARQNDPVGAMGALSQALALQPEDLEVLILLADVQYKMGDPAAARETLEQGLQRHPRHEGLVLRMARLLSVGGQPVESLKWYRKAVQCAPSSHAAWSGYAGLLLRLGQRDEAIAVLKKQLSVSPNHPDALAQLAVLQSIRGDQVSKRFLDTLEGRGHPSVRHLARGRIQLQQGHVKRALQSFQAALKQPSQPAFHRLARHYRDMAQSQLANPTD